MNICQQPYRPPRARIKHAKKLPLSPARRKRMKSWFARAELMRKEKRRSIERRRKELAQQGANIPDTLFRL